MDPSSDPFGAAFSRLGRRQRGEIFGILLVLAGRRSGLSNCEISTFGRKKFVKFDGIRVFFCVFV